MSLALNVAGLARSLGRKLLTLSLNIASGITGGSGGGGEQPVVGLDPLILSTYEFPENSAPGTVIATITNRAVGSTLSVTPADGRFAVVGSNLVVGATVSGFANYPIAITESIGPLSLLTEMTLTALSAISFDSTRTRADSTRTSDGLQIRSTLQEWNQMLAVLKARRGG